MPENLEDLGLVEVAPQFRPGNNIGRQI